MKEHQFEEITFWLSMIACLLSYLADTPELLKRSLILICIFNACTTTYYSYKDYKEEKNSRTKDKDSEK